MKATKILIIDDEPQIRRLLRFTLESKDYAVISAANGQEGLAMAANHNPDLILLDIALPDQSGHEVLQELQGWCAKPVIMLSVLDNEQDIVRALDTGAVDYLTKPFRSRELLARIRSGLRYKQEPSTSPLIQIGNIKIDLSARTVTKSGVLLRFTPTEYKLLCLLAKYEGRVLTHQQLLKEVWGIAYQKETQYLRVYIGQIRKKIEDNPNAPDLLITEPGIGYRLG
ncbi:response regulator [Phaeodactylibacter xiamenensis]|uniref:response regulator n=1 Tax=Phaeodactylibacter xiamenensis TaxID=1524460 RepID=UPI0024A80DBC|nr:response regulator transcription factor [Phaeodactylibacter xiamenensis]